MSNEISSFRKDEISQKKSFDIGAVLTSKSKLVEATFYFVAFDNVSSTLLLVWTGFSPTAPSPTIQYFYDWRNGEVQFGGEITGRNFVLQNS